MKKRTGFALLSPDKVRELARKGGTNAQAKGTGHRFAAGEEAVTAGRKGGTEIAKDRCHMVRIGRKGAVSTAIIRRPVTVEDYKAAVADGLILAPPAAESPPERSTP